MRLALRPLIATLLSAALIPIVSAGVARNIDLKFPHATEIPVTDDYLQDVGSLLIGSHRMAADLAYVQALQYYGTSADDGGDVDEHINQVGHYPLLKTLT